MKIFQTTNKIQDEISKMPPGTEKRFNDYNILVVKTATGTSISISGETHFAKNSNLLRPYIRTQVKMIAENTNKRNRKKNESK